MRIIKGITGLTITLAVMLCCACGTGSGKTIDDSTSANTTNSVYANDSYAVDTEEIIEIYCPWNEEGAKQPSEYTWEEFEALDGPQQIQFQYSFDSFEDFDKWMQKAEYVAENGTNPWEVPGAKQPPEYTWEEFEALTGPQQIQFQYSFDSFEDFDKWVQKAEYVAENGIDPWDVPGAKQPSEYSWEEYEALTGSQQMTFQFSFNSFEDFDAWLTANQPK